MSKAVVRIQPKFRPISGDIIGYRLQAAIPNTAGRRMVMTSNGPRATDEEVPAFRKPFLIEESMDYSSIQSVSEVDCERFAKQLNWAGYDHFQFLADADDPLRERLVENFSVLSK